MHCPDDETLARLRADDLPTAAAAATADHVRECKACAARLAGLAADDELGRDLRAAHASATSAPAATAPRAGTRIGEFQLLRVLGEGGMGVVFEAEQERPHRKVALKVLRAGVVSGRSLRRFELEAELLGRLQHPGIARILSSGTFPSVAGPQPYFAMELVAGRPLREHAGGLDRDAKVRLLVALCEAVQHAHEKGVIHRDLKPENVLVDANGRPVVLDFGVAKLAEPDRAVSAGTLAGQLVGTLPYMSPEQLAGTNDDVDVRTDVRALGVIAYELLGGALPHDVADLPLATAAQRICEHEPTPLPQLAPGCAGDLATVVHKALAADKARRYGSAAAFGRDLERVLEHLPVEARPATTWYFVRRFARRNRGLVGLAAAGVLALCAGIVATTWQANRAHAAELQARADQGRAEDETRHARAARDLLQEVLIQASPAESGGGGEGLAKALALAVGRVGDRNDPLVEAALCHTHGRVLVGWGRYQEGRDRLLRALELFEQQPGRSDVAWVLAHLAEAHLKLGELDAAERCVRRAAALAAAFPTRPDLLLATAANALGVAHFGAGRLAAAEACFRQAIASYDRVGGDQGAVNAAIARASVARVLVQTGHLDDAAAEFDRAIPVQRRILGRSAPVASALANHAALFEARADWPRARELLAESHALRVELQGADSAPAALVAIRLALAEERLGDATAKGRAEAALATASRQLGEQHREVVKARSLLGR